MSEGKAMKVFDKIIRGFASFALAATLVPASAIPAIALPEGDFGNNSQTGDVAAADAAAADAGEASQSGATSDTAGSSDGRIKETLPLQKGLENAAAAEAAAGEAGSAASSGATGSTSTDDPERPETTSQTEPLESTSSSSPDSAADGVNADDTDVTSKDMINISQKVSDEETEADANLKELEELDLISTSVNLTSGAGTILALNGLSYVVNEDGATVTFTGPSAAITAAETLSGTLAIPSEVTIDGTSYPVTAIEPSQEAAAVAQRALAQNASDTARAVAMAEAVASVATAPGVTDIQIPATVEYIDPAVFAAFPNAQVASVAGGSAHFTSVGGALYALAKASAGVSYAHTLVWVPEAFAGKVTIPQQTQAIAPGAFARASKVSAIAVEGADGTGLFGADDADAVHDADITDDADATDNAEAGSGESASDQGDQSDSNDSDAGASSDEIKTNLATNDLGELSSAYGALYAGTTLIAAPAGTTGALKVADGCTDVAEAALWSSAPSKITSPDTVSHVATETLDDASDADGQPIYISIGAAQSSDATTVIVPTGAQAAKEAWEAAGFAVEEGEEEAPQGEVIVDGLKYEVLPDETLAVSLAPEANVDRVSIPESVEVNGMQLTVTQVAAGAFANSGLRWIELPYTVEVIGVGAFEGCAALQSAWMGDGLREIRARAFAGCTSLLSLILPPGFQRIGSQAFEGVGGTTVVALSDMITVEPTAFEGSTAIAYCPTGSTGVWETAGADARGYSATSSDEVAQIEVGEKSDVAGALSLEVPEGAKAEWSYGAAVTVDTETGTLTGMTPGRARVSAEITLDVPVAGVVPASRTAADARAASTEAQTGGDQADEAQTNERAARVLGGADAQTYTVNLTNALANYEVARAASITITSQPKGGSYAEGNKIVLHISASISENKLLSYQWYRGITSDPLMADPIDGATSSTLEDNIDGSLTAEKSGTPYYYYCKVTDPSGNYVNSDVATVTLFPKRGKNGEFLLDHLAEGDFKSTKIWRSTHTYQMLEVQPVNYSGNAYDLKTNPDGSTPLSSSIKMAELCANEPSSLYQEVATVPGSVYHFSLNHGYRGVEAYPIQQMAVVIGPAVDTQWDNSQEAGMESATVDDTTYPYGKGQNLTMFQCIYNQLDVSQLNDSTPVIVEYHGANYYVYPVLNGSLGYWTNHQGYYTVPEGQGMTVFAFISLTPREGSFGNLLSGISFQKSSPIEADVEYAEDGSGKIIVKNTTSNNRYGILEMRGSTSFQASGVEVAFGGVSGQEPDEWQWYNPGEGGITFSNLIPGKTYRVVSVPYDCTGGSSSNIQGIVERPFDVVDTDCYRDFIIPAVNFDEGALTIDLEMIDLNHFRLDASPANRFVEYALVNASMQPIRDWFTTTDGHFETTLNVGYTGEGNASYGEQLYLVGRPMGYTEITYAQAVLDGNCATVSIPDRPRITTQPLGGNYAKGNKIVLHVAATSSTRGLLNYQWYRSKSKNFTDADAIAGATSSTLEDNVDGSLEAAAEGTTYYYRCVVAATSSLSVESDIAEVMLLPKVGKDGQPLLDHLAEGDFKSTKIWRSTHTYQMLEVQPVNYSGNAYDLKTNPDGSTPLSSSIKMAELCANEPSSLYQEVATVPGSVYHFSLNHGYRGVEAYPIQQMAVVIGPAVSSLWDQSQDGLTGKLVNSTYPYGKGQADTMFEYIYRGIPTNELADGQPIIVDYHGDDYYVYPILDGELGYWTHHEGYYTIPEGQGATVFAFINLTPRSGSFGNLLSDIVFEKASPIDATIKYADDGSGVITVGKTREDYRYGLLEMRGSTASSPTDIDVSYGEEAGQIPTSLQWYNPAGKSISFSNLTPGKTYRVVGVPYDCTGDSIKNIQDIIRTPFNVSDASYYKDFPIPAVATGGDSLQLSIEMVEEHNYNIVIDPASRFVEYAVLNLSNEVIVGWKSTLDGRLELPVTVGYDGEPAGSKYQAEYKETLRILARPLGYNDIDYDDVVANGTYSEIELPGNEFHDVKYDEITDKEWADSNKFKLNSLEITNTGSIAQQYRVFDATTDMALTDWVTIEGTPEGGSEGASNSAKLILNGANNNSVYHVVTRLDETSSQSSGLRLYPAPSEELTIDYKNETIGVSSENGLVLPTSLEYQIKTSLGAWLLGTGANRWIAGTGNEPVALEDALNSSAMGVTNNATITVRHTSSFSNSYFETRDYEIAHRPAAPVFDITDENAKTDDVSILWKTEKIAANNQVEYKSGNAKVWNVLGANNERTFEQLGWNELSGVALYIRYGATNSAFASAQASRTLPKRSNAPTAPYGDLGESPNQSTLYDVTTAMEYREISETAWHDGTGSNITGLKDTAYLVRTKATNTAVSSMIKTVPMAVTTEVGVANVSGNYGTSLAFGSYTSDDTTFNISLKNISQNKVMNIKKVTLSDSNHFESVSTPIGSIASGEKKMYQIKIKDSFVNLGLDPGKYSTKVVFTYTINDKTNEYTLSQEVSMTVVKSSQLDPIVSVQPYYNRLDVTASVPSANYARDPENHVAYFSLNNVDWFVGTPNADKTKYTYSFPNLSPTTLYTVFVRYEANDKYYQSARKAKKYYTSYEAPSADAVIIDYAKESVWYDSSQYEMTKSDKTSAVVVNFVATQLLDDANGADVKLNIRRKASTTSDGTIPASAWTEVALPGRPEAPQQAVITIKNASYTDKEDGEVRVGNAVAIHYRSKDASSWEEETTNRFNGPMGKYLVRYASTGSNFASRPAEVEILANKGYISYHLKYDKGSNGAGDTIEKAEVELRKAFSTPKTPDARRGYTFYKWYTNDGLSTEFKAFTPTGDFDLYAKWDQRTYTITYNLNGGSTSAGDMALDRATKSVKYEDRNSTTIGDAAKRKGRVFKGWATTQKLDSTIENTANINATYKTTTNIGAVFDELWPNDGNLNVTLYAVWYDEPFTLQYYRGDSTSNFTAGASTAISGNTQTIYYKNIETQDADTPCYKITPETIQDTGWDLIGWTRSERKDPAATVAANSYYSVRQGSDGNNGIGTLNGSVKISDEAFGLIFGYNAGTMAFDNTKTGKLSGVWSAHLYTVTLKAGPDGTDAKIADGKNVTSYQYNQSITLPGVNDVTRTGYTFAGWYDDFKGTTTFGEGKEKNSIVPTDKQDLNLYGKWNAHTYKIKFDGNGSTSGSMSDLPMTYDVAANLTNNAFARNGYDFLGWANSKELADSVGAAGSLSGDGTYSNQASVNNLTATNNGEYTLYAVWKPKTDLEYTVKHVEVLADGTTERQVPGSSDQTVSNQTMDTKVTVTPDTITGYTSPAAQEITIGHATDGTYTTNREVKLYYTPIEYTIKFNGDGATGGMPSDMTATYNRPYTIPAAPTKTGYTFQGWKFDDGATNFTLDAGKTYSAVSQEDDPTGAVVDAKYNLRNAAGDVTLTAQWTAQQHDIVFDRNTPTASGELLYGASSPVRYDGADMDATRSDLANKATVAASIPELKDKTKQPTLAGWTFKGWYSGETQYYDENGNKQAVTYPVTDTPVALKAKWEPNEHTLTFNLNKPSDPNDGASAEVVQGDVPLSKPGVKYDHKLPNVGGAPTLSGWTLKGWFDTSSGGTQYYYADGTPVVYNASSGEVLSEGSTGDGTKIRTLTVDDNVTLYAQWEPLKDRSYTVKHWEWMDEPHSVKRIVPGKTDKTVNNAIMDKTYTETSPVITGYTAGKPSDTIKVSKLEDNVLDLYYTPITYTIAFDGDGATGGMPESNVTAKYNRAYTIPNVTPTKQGYTFKGWSWKEGVTADNAMQPGATYSPDPDDGANCKAEYNLSTTAGATVTLTAIWENNTYTMKFNPSKPANATNDVKYKGSAMSSDMDLAQTATYATEIPDLKGDTVAPTLDGWSFTGWYYNNGSTNVKFYNADGTKVADTTYPAVDTAIVLTAGWEQNHYNIKFVATIPTGATAGDKIDNMPETLENVAYDGEYTLPANVPTLAGYDFAGWKIADPGDTHNYPLMQPGQKHQATVANPEYNLATPSADGTTDAVLTGVWTPHVYKVVFDGNGSDAGDVPVYAGEITYGTSSALVPATPEGFGRRGYKLVGWSTNQNAGSEDEGVLKAGDAMHNLTTEGGKAYEDAHEGQRAVATLYAVWQEGSYTVEFSTWRSDNEDAKAPAFADNEFKFTESFTVPDTPATLTRTGYDFVGWTLASEGAAYGYEGSADGVAGLPSGSVYAAGDSVSELGDADDVVTLYPVWQAKTFKITYKANNDTDESYDVTYTYDGYAEPTKIWDNKTEGGADRFTRAGYKFDDGWTSSDGKTWSAGEELVPTFASLDALASQTNSRWKELYETKDAQLSAVWKSMVNVSLPSAVPLVFETGDRGSVPFTYKATTQTLEDVYIVGASATVDGDGWQKLFDSADPDAKLTLDDAEATTIKITPESYEDASMVVPLSGAEVAAGNSKFKLEKVASPEDSNTLMLNYKMLLPDNMRNSMEPVEEKTPLAQLVCTISTTDPGGSDSGSGGATGSDEPADSGDSE